MVPRRHFGEADGWDASPQESAQLTQRYRRSFSFSKSSGGEEEKEDD
jgi:hypothetical protein